MINANNTFHILELASPKWEFCSHVHWHPDLKADGTDTRKVLNARNKVLDTLKMVELVCAFSEPHWSSNATNGHFGLPHARDHPSSLSSPTIVEQR